MFPQPPPTLLTFPVSLALRWDVNAWVWMAAMLQPVL